MVDEFLKKKGSKDSIEVLLNPLSLLSSPFDYEDLKKSIDFLKEKSEYGEKALLIAHEDMDGIASLIISILMILFFLFIQKKAAGFPISLLQLFLFYCFMATIYWKEEILIIFIARILMR
jgi:hypothetical protein